MSYIAHQFSLFLKHSCSKVKACYNYNRILFLGDDIGLLRACPHHETQEVNEFLEKGVKSGANALMTTLSFFSRPVFSRKVNLMMILAPSFPTVHYIMAPQEREFFFKAIQQSQQRSWGQITPFSTPIWGVKIDQLIGSKQHCTTRLFKVKGNKTLPKVCWSGSKTKRLKYLDKWKSKVWRIYKSDEKCKIYAKPGEKLQTLLLQSLRTSLSEWKEKLKSRNLVQICLYFQDKLDFYL